LLQSVQSDNKRNLHPSLPNADIPVAQPKQDILDGRYWTASLAPPSADSTCRKANENAALAVNHEFLESSIPHNFVYTLQASQPKPSSLDGRRIAEQKPNSWVGAPKLNNIPRMSCARKIINNAALPLVGKESNSSKGSGNILALARQISTFKFDQEF
jgi:hypothetical protein